MKIPIVTGEMPMPDGSVIRLMLNKDWEQLRAALDSIEAQEIVLEAKDAQALKRDAWLAHRPDKNGQWLRRKDDCRTRAKCQICKGGVYWWENQTQLWMHCGCTIFIMPRSVPHIEQMKKITSSDWTGTARMALEGIQQWLETS